MEQVASHYPDVEVKVVDIGAEPARFAELRVMSIPAIVLNGRLEFTGLPKEAQLRAKIDDCISQRP